MSCAAFDRFSNRVAHFLFDGISVPETLAGFMGNDSFDFYFKLFGCARIRSGLVIYNWRLAASELA